MDIYKLASWLTYNHGFIRYELEGNLIKARSMDKNDAKEYILDNIAYIVAKYHPTVMPSDIEILLDSDEVKIVLYTYYLKEFYNTH